MTTEPNMVSTIFGALPIGAKFFDPYSGEYWVKLGERSAQLRDAPSEGVDTFPASDTVYIEP